MEAVAAGEMDERDWQQDPDEAADNNDPATDDEWNASAVADDGDGEDSSGGPPRPTRARPKRRPANLSSNENAGAGNARSSRVPQLGADPLTVEELHVDFVAELRVALGLAEKMVGASDAPSVAPRCVSGAWVIVFVELFDPLCVWSAAVAGSLLTFCFCGGILGSGRHIFTRDTIEHVNLQVALNKSSTCRHARALQLAYDELASEYEADDIDELLDLFPDLAGAEEDKQEAEDADTAVHLALHSGKKEDVPIFAILYEGVWSPAIVRRRSNKHHLPTCFLLSCSSHP